MNGRSWTLWPVLVTSLVGCGSTRPPSSQFPDARSAVGRLDATYASVTGLQGSATIDYLSDRGRVRGDLSMLVTAPAKLRFAVRANVVGAAGEVASDGLRFTADDKAHGRYVFGPATPCNVARITQVPLASKELVPMLWGMRPAIDEPISCSSLRWDRDGYYAVMLGQGARAHELHLAPHPDDWAKPWSAQRVRLVGVIGWQDERMLYRVTLRDHRPTGTASPLVDPDGLNPDVPPSGPMVTVDVPRALHVEMPDRNTDVLLRIDQAYLNPPLLPKAFEIAFTPGVPAEESMCSDR